MRLGLAGLALLAAALLSGCATEAAAGPTPSPEPARHTTTTTTTTTTPEPPPPPPPPPCGRGISACVDLSARQAWLMDNGTVTRGPVAITHGGTTNPTPTGTWPVAWKDQEHTSSIYGDPMPYSVFFAPGGIAFHEGKLDEDSHGCVRLAMADAKAFFTALPVGALVQVVA
ncbi:MAG: L,D-transpeptidase [Actinomycetota bacterium]|nr:L,D-transpeptidase [Actinomycetota bacterium]